ncbi:MAG: FRG domain-containing protein [Planctomycetes bacterium]|nr:FRG domain-containing protein [Planctomycetota bacterium]
MQTIRLKSWERFGATLARLRGEAGAEVRMLFRGQGDARWPLATTLERRSAVEFDVARYVRLAAKAAPDLECLTGRSWDVPTFARLKELIRSKSETFLVHLPVLDLLVYLRQNGYASPLLDWSESPYVAAYFAYLDAGTATPAVHCLVRRPNAVKGGLGGEPMISVQSQHHVGARELQLVQRTRYTIATRWDHKRSVHVFCPHEQVLDAGDDHADRLVKITLPAKDRAAALRQLEDFGLNHFSLFRSEGALVRALETRHFDLDDPEADVTPAWSASPAPLSV